MTGTTRSAIDHQRVIAIDGPAAAGKSTVARMLADRLGALLFDTGALYRAVALVALRSSIATEDAASLARIAREMEIRIGPASYPDGRLYDVWIEGEDVTWTVRSPEVGAIVSQVAEHHEVRDALLPLQRRIASGSPVVMVGRDIGTIVVPDAGLKVFLDATAEERARRRYKEATARGGRESFAQVLEETLHRDTIDSGRETAPLREAADAIRIDTDDRSIVNVVESIEGLARAQRTPCGDPIWPA